jgi:hypothetical protein
MSVPGLAADVWHTLCLNVWTKTGLYNLSCQSTRARTQTPTICEFLSSVFAQPPIRRQHQLKGDSSRYAPAANLALASEGSAQRTCNSETEFEASGRTVRRGCG